MKRLVVVATVVFLACRPSESADGARAGDASAPLSAPSASASPVLDAGAPAPSASVAVAPSASASAGPSAGLDPAFGGVHHLDVQPDEHNLVIAADGTFFWEVFGCDFGGGGCGVWKPDGDGIVLVPKPPAATMPWSGAPPVTRVVLRSRAGGLDAQVFSASGAPVKQRWMPGEVCAQCGGGLGPTSPLKACSKPLKPACN